MLDEKPIEKIMQEDKTILLKSIFASKRLSILMPLLKKMSKKKLQEFIADANYRSQLLRYHSKKIRRMIIQN